QLRGVIGHYAYDHDSVQRCSTARQRATTQQTPGFAELLRRVPCHVYERCAGNARAKTEGRSAQTLQVAIQVEGVGPDQASSTTDAPRVVQHPLVEVFSHRGTAEHDAFHCKELPRSGYIGAEQAPQ